MEESSLLSKQLLLLPSYLSEIVAGAEACSHWRLDQHHLEHPQSGLPPADLHCVRVKYGHLLACHEPAAGPFGDTAAHKPGISQGFAGSRKQLMARTPACDTKQAYLANCRTSFLGCGLVGVPDEAESFALSSPLASIQTQSSHLPYSSECLLDLLFCSIGRQSSNKHFNCQALQLRVIPRRVWVPANISNGPACTCT